MTQIERLHRRHLMNNGRSVILATDDSGGVHKAQIRPTPNEIIDDVPVLQLYGFSGHAPVGSEAHVLCTRGDRSSSVVIATNNGAARFKNLAPGEVAIYTDEGDYVRFARGKIVEIHCGGQVTIQAPNGKVRVETPRLECTGDIIDHCDSQNNTQANMRAIYNSHTHGGVQSGGAHTAVPDQKQRTADDGVD